MKSPGAEFEAAEASNVPSKFQFIEGSILDKESYLS